ncbi:MAG: bifunctional 2-C-methyl-D-erythritol 4-phosphate cytidylyltransferase/2-C-methyl-D-erythritol 2,4-cyclodiphosphate synthase [Pseudomonadota bacterium]
MTGHIYKDIGAVIVAAGRGARSGLDGPKQYHLLAKKAVLVRTYEAICERISPQNIIIVHHIDDEELLASAFEAHLAQEFHSTIGGKTRQASVLAGLNALKSLNISLRSVMIHDAARPFVSCDLLDALEEQATRFPDQGVLPVLPIAETVKRISDDQVEATISRQGLATAQTPQLFPLNLIIEAHKAATDVEHEFTDDASIFEWYGKRVKTVEGEKDNIKLTYAADFERAEKTIQMRENEPTQLPDIRTGHGYDVHRFTYGDHVMLCGVRVAHNKSLSGHSDADVGLHALTDALLATCAAGDIGDHFPPTDPKWKGAESHVFLTEAIRLVATHGGTVLNVDITLICEAPKIGPHRERMRQRLAELCGIDIERCSVKATTNEKMGFIGRDEGMCAMATASVRYT